MGGWMVFRAAMRPKKAGGMIGKASFETFREKSQADRTYLREINRRRIDAEPKYVVANEHLEVREIKTGQLVGWVEFPKK